MLGIQFARLSGCRVVVTSSPRNFDYLLSLGAEAVFDHADPDCAAKIRSHFAEPNMADDLPNGSTEPADTENELRLVWDCVSTPDTAKMCAAAMSPTRGGRYRSLLRVDDPILHEVNPNIDGGFTFAYTVFGEVFNKFRVHEPSEKDFEFGKNFWDLSHQLLTARQIKPVRFEVNRGGSGLEGVMVGMEELKGNKVSGLKLVYTL
jgi:NADPH:quinone reductase-like Zn-dependent oxidoreductase